MRKNAQFILYRLSHWHGEMTESSVGATVYSVWHYHFLSSLFADFIEDEEIRLTLAANYPFIDYFQRMIHGLGEDPKEERFNKICRGYYPTEEYKGDEPCIYNMVRAMADTYEFLITEVSKDMNDWKWGNIHVNEYANLPWSLTPLKPLFHREISTGGNGNTVKVSKYSLKKFKAQKSFKSSHTPNYKQIVQLGEDEKFLFSFDGGQNGNLLGGHYFDFAKSHTQGHLMEGVVGKNAVE